MPRKKIYTEEELLKGIVNGDPDIRDHLKDHCRKKLKYLQWRYSLRDPFTQNSIISDTLSITWENICQGQYEDRGDVKKYISGILKNICRDFRKKTRKEIPLEYYQEEPAPSKMPVENSTDLHSAIENLQDYLSFDLKKWLLRKNTRDQKIFKLHLVDDLNPEQIATELNLPPHRIGVRLSQLKAELKELQNS
ncbi:MAG: sigma-70 family RNA polymerase sigma factor [Bacteroidetes bacterium]|nr:sigma-70 family RNA polymerase sigma factor [Bacteroidota bacterium]